VKVSKNSLEALAKNRIATQFSKDNPPKNPGRKPSVLRYVKDNGVSITDIKRILGSFIFDYTAKEIKDLLKDKENPPSIGVLIILETLTEDLRNKKLSNFEKLFAMAYGKPTQGLDITTSPEGNQIANMTNKERQDRIKELLKKRLEVKK
jgi:DNA-binding transcriptional MerR regulator